MYSIIHFFDNTYRNIALLKIMEYVVANIFKHMKVRTLSRILSTSNKFNNCAKRNLSERMIRIEGKTISYENLGKVMGYFGFRNIDLSGKYITDEHLKLIKDCHTVNLRWCNYITESGFKQLCNCKTIILDLNEISDIEPLRNCRNISLYSCTNIEDEQFTKLKNCHSLDLQCTNVNISARELGMCHKLNLCENIIDKENLCNVTKNCYMLTLNENY